MTSKTAKKAIAIFFLVFGLGLAGFILMQGVGVFQGSRDYVASTSGPSVDCIKYFYEVGDVSYSGGELEFEVSNLDYSIDISNLTVVSSGSQALPVSLPAGTSQRIRVAADVADNFSVFPDGCSVYGTTCYLGTGLCS